MSAEMLEYNRSKYLFFIMSSTTGEDYSDPIDAMDSALYYINSIVVSKARLRTSTSKCRN